MAEETENAERAQQWLEELSADDEFESLRQKSARASTIYEDMAAVEAPAAAAGRPRGRFTPLQRVILALLVFLNVIALGVALLIITERIPPLF
jgi:hypothetical protein